MVVFDTKQAKGLLALRKFVENSPSQIINSRRDILHIIDNALTEGCYSSKHQKKLNQIRNVWFDQTYAGQYICRYCLGDTSQVDYDYLSGTDHLQCQLKYEMEK